MHTLTVALLWWAAHHNRATESVESGPLLRLINVARLFPQEPSRQLPRHRAEACVAESCSKVDRVYVADSQLLTYAQSICRVLLNLPLQLVYLAHGMT